MPVNCVRRLESTGKLALNLMELQSGLYLGENDIVRREDIYKRIGPADGEPAVIHAVDLDVHGVNAYRMAWTRGDTG